MATRIRFSDRADFVAQVSAAVRRVAPELGMSSSPTDAFVTAHAALSSGYGRAVWDWNLWGIKAGRTWRGPTWTSETTEYVGGVIPVRETARWRSYPTPDDAVRDYFRLLSVSRYRSSIAALRAGDEQFMYLLGTEGWYTAAPARVSADWQATLSRVRELMGVAPQTVAGVGGSMIWIGVGFAAMMAWRRRRRRSGR